jgi:hypothetical protein
MSSMVRWSISLVASIGVLAALVAAAIIWLLLTDPVQVASAVSTGDLAPILEAIGTVVLDALRALFRFL